MLRVLARRRAVALWRSEPVPPTYLILLDRLAAVLRGMGEELAARRLPRAAPNSLVEMAEASSHLELSGSISAVVILAPLRSVIAGLLELTGMEYAEARELTPETDPVLQPFGPSEEVDGQPES